MEGFWRSWLYQLDPYTRLLSTMLSTELHGLNIRCAADEFTVFNPPSGQTCLEWAGDFVNYYGGYLNNPNATDACQYCQYAVRSSTQCGVAALADYAYVQAGDQFYTPLNILYSNRWRDVFILLAFSGTSTP